MPRNVQREGQGPGDLRAVRRAWSGSLQQGFFSVGEACGRSMEGNERSAIHARRCRGEGLQAKDPRDTGEGAGGVEQDTRIRYQGEGRGRTIRRRRAICMWC